MCTGCSTQKKLVEGEMHLLPAGYTGTVLLLFNQAGALQVTSSGGMRVYLPDATGVFRTSAPQLKGYFPCDLMRYAYLRGTDTTDIPELALTYDSVVRRDQLYIYDRYFGKDTIRYQVGYPPADYHVKTRRN
jgi:hypothetical protein